jgi:2'-hydroxyisoflavone reductase
VRLLAIGGTGFLGSHVAEAARDHAHEVTVLSRGLTAAPAMAGVERLVADREGDLAVLRGRSWEVVVDICGHVPGVVAASAAALADAELYTFVSSTSVYARSDLPPGEDSAVRRLPAGELEGFGSDDDITGESYGPLKTACEDAVRSVFGGRALIIRPVLINGPRDRAGRLPYWLARLAEGGEILAPGNPARPIQMVDVRDLATWIVDMAEFRTGGTYNAGDPNSAAFADILDACAQYLGLTPQLTWVDDDFLLGQGLVPDGDDLPLWFTAETTDWAPVDTRRAHSAGLQARALDDTVAATWAWMVEGPPRTPEPDLGREAELLRLWARR